MAIDREAWKYLVGEWEGGHEGDPGQGPGMFSFCFELDKNILVRPNRTTFPATAEREGTTHDDWLIIYTEINGLKRGIYFNNEEHVINYEVKPAKENNLLVLESDRIPSAPRFRFTYIETDENSLVARFKAAPPGQAGEFFTYLEGTAKRVNSR